MDEQNKEKPRRKYGDLIIWLQLLDEVRNRKTPAIFITADEKPDWWTIIDSEGKHIIGPRPELIQEMFEQTGTPFYMYSPPEFMKYVGKLLQEEVSQKALEEAKAVDEARVQSIWSGIGAVGSAIYSGSVPGAVSGAVPPGAVLSGAMATGFPLISGISTAWTTQKLKLEVGKFAHEWESARIREPPDIAGAQNLLSQYGTLLMGLSIEALRCGIPISQELLAVGKRMTEFGSAVVANDPAVTATFWQMGQDMIIELKTLLARLH
jgi:PIN like domain